MFWDDLEGFDKYLKEIQDLDPCAVEMRPGDCQALDRFLAGTTDSPGYLTTNVEYDPYDARLFREFLNHSDDLANLAKTPDAPKTFAPLLMDLFLYFFKFHPCFLEPGAVEPAHLRANRGFLTRLGADEAAMITRLSTTLDDLLSGQAAIEAGRRILEELRERPALKEWMERQAESQAEPPAESQPEPPQPHDPDGPVDPQANLEEERHPTVLEDAAEPGPSEGPPPKDMTATVRAAAEAGANEAQEIVAAVAAWGLEPSDLKRVPLGERIQLAKKLRTRRLRDLAKMLGRARNTKDAVEKKKTPVNHDERHSITLSGDLSRTLSSERVSAFGSGNPYRELDFYRRLSENAVPSYRLRTEEPTGRGPVVAMVDASGSMAGEPMQWASSVALALAHPGPRRPGTNARNVTLIFFNARIVLEVEIDPAERDINKLVSIGTVNATGGTNYVPPLQRALDIAREKTAGSAQGNATGNVANTASRPPESRRRPDKTTSRTRPSQVDFLLVTDGLCKLPESFQKSLGREKSALGFKLVSVLIGGRAGDLDAFSETVIPVEYLAGSERDAAREVFEAL